MSQSDCAPTQRYSIPHGLIRLEHSLSPPIPRAAVSGHALSRSTRKQPDRTHVASMPDTTWPINGHPPDLSRVRSDASVSMPTYFFDTSNSDRLPDPHLTHHVRLFPLAHHDRPQLTQQWVVWSLPPQGDSGGPTSISRAASPQEALPNIKLPSTFGTQQSKVIRAPVRGRRGAG